MYSCICTSIIIYYTSSFIRFVSEKMCLGGLLLEGCNSEFWVALGCLSDHSALKQHAFIRALQLDVSLAVAWAHLGKVTCCLSFQDLSDIIYSRNCQKWITGETKSLVEHFVSWIT